MKTLRTLVVALLAGFVVVHAGASPTATAADRPTPGKGAWSVGPGGAAGGSDRSAFVYTMKPGTVLRDSVRIANTGRRPVTVDLYAADAFVVPEDGAFAIRNADEPRTGVSRWVRLAKSRRHRIRPGKALEVPFEVRVPRNAEPGDHVGALIAAGARTEKGGGQGALGFDVRRRIGSRLYLRVEGDLRPELAVSSLEVTGDPDLVPLVGGDGRTEVSWEISNPGNVRMTPEARIELRGPFGNLVQSQAVEVAELLPGSTVVGTTVLDSLPAWGRLRAELVVTSDDASTSAADTIWALPWVPVAVLVLLALLWWLRGRHRRGRPLLPLPRRRGQRSGVDDGPAAVPGHDEPVATPVARLALTAAAITLPALALAVPHAVADTGPAVVLDVARAEVGAPVAVQGVGWSAGDLVEVSVCGRGGATTADCATQTARQVGVDASGGFSVPVTVAPPPRACPCVVAVAGAGGVRVTAPLRVLGHPARPVRPTRTAEVVVRDATLEGGTSLGPWFGLPATPTLVLTVANTGSAAATPRVDVGWSSGEGPAHVVPPPRIGRLEPGEERTVRMPVRFDALGNGPHRVWGTVDVDGTEELFAATTGVRPWGLLPVTALLVGGGLLLGWRRHARRHPEQIPHPQEAPVLLGT